MEKRPLLFLRAIWLFFLLAVPAAVTAADFRIVSDTILRGFERDTRGGEDVVVPLYEYLQADVGVEGEQPLTFHLYGWGRLDLAGSDYFENRFIGGGDDAAGELLYGYLQYDLPDTSLTARLGRQYVFEGVANESFDGLRLQTDLGDLFAASAYGGQPVALDTTEGRSGDSIYGGRLAHHRRGLYEIGLSYKSIDNDGGQAEEMLGIDLSLLLPGGVSLFGFSSRNLDTEGWAEHFYEARFSVANVLIRPFFERYKYEDYFATGENTGRPFLVHPALDETLTVFGVDLLWPQGEKWEWGLKGKFYDYDERGDSAQFVSAIAVWHGDGLTQVGGELGRMNGDRDNDRYLLGRLYSYRDLGNDQFLKFYTADLVSTWYDEEIQGESASLFLSVGTGTRLLKDALELKVSADFSSDPYFDSDFRGWLLARYAFSL